LIVFSTAVDYLLGARLEREQSLVRRKLLLTLSLTSNLGLLGVFKYADFFRDNMCLGLRLLGFDVSWTSLNIILPVGISFYTFQTMSYTIDVYRGRLKACRNPLDFALFVAFFPQLVAGPIVRAAAFLPQLQRPASMCIDRRALFLIARGLAKKVLVADNVAVFADAVFKDPSVWPSAIVWMAAVCFYVQIYCDFSGYSDMAIGVGRMLGYHLPRNFDRPYFSRSPTEFWHRWHISLSTWLRDYLYIPLGGNRGGTWMTCRNVMLVMLLGGLWHGASWNFVLWGFLHGLALIAHRAWRASRERHPIQLGRRLHAVYNVLAWAATQYWMLLAWIAFRVQDSGAMLNAMRKFVLFDFDFAVRNVGLGRMSFFSTLAILSAFLALHMLSRWRGGIDQRLARSPLWVATPACVMLGMLLYWVWPLAETPFIYFQF
jgi:alginate O-acetyltransferase complex protein AlgI